MGFDVVRYAGGAGKNTYTSDARFIVMCSCFALLAMASIKLLGCSGCGEEKIQKLASQEQEGKTSPTQNLTSSKGEIQNVQAGGVAQHTHAQVVSTPPKPSSLGLKRLVGQKHPSMMSDTEMKYAFYEAVKLAETNPSEAQERMHQIAQEIGTGDPDWTEYLHLLGHALIEPPLSSNKMYMSPEDSLRFDELKLKLYGENAEVRQQIEKAQLAIQWNQERFEVSRQIEPIGDVLTWMEEHAKDEWEVVNSHYTSTVQERVREFYPFKSGWLTPKQRADIRYEVFFDALELLPDDSVTLHALFETNHSSAQETLLSKQVVIQAEPPQLSEPSETPTHTWDMVHETPAIVDEVDIETPARPNNSVRETAQLPVPSDVATDFEKAMPTDTNGDVKATFQEEFKEVQPVLDHNDPEAGHRRLKADDPEISETEED